MLSIILLAGATTAGATDPCTVTSLDDDGDGALRDCIEKVNANPDGYARRIEFNVADLTIPAPGKSGDDVGGHGGLRLNLGH